MANASVADSLYPLHLAATENKLGRTFQEFKENSDVNYKYYYQLIQNSFYCIMRLRVHSFGK